MSGEDRLLLIGCFFTLGVVLAEICNVRVVLVTGFCVVAGSFVTARFLIQERERVRLMRHVSHVACACVIILLGALVMNACTVRRQNLRELVSCISGKTCEVQGIVTDMPEVDDEGKWKIVVTGEIVSGDIDSGGMRILLTGTTGPEGGSQFQMGHVVSACGRFYLPGAPLNPGEPDMERIMAYRRLDGTLYVEDTRDVHVLDWRKPNLMRRAAVWFRDTVMATCGSTLIPRHASMLSGMLLGQAPSHMKSALEATGTSHLFAASGLHVGYVVLAVMTLLMPLRLPMPGRLVVALMFIWIYAVACGLRASIVRATLMFSFAAVPRVVGRKIAPKSALALASLVMFATNPYAVFDAGAQLSFLVVLSIIYLYPKVQKWFQPLGYYLSHGFALSVSAQAGAAPLIAWYFGVFTPIGIIANVPCVLLAGVAVLIGLYATLVGLVFPSAASALNAANSLVLLALENTVEFLSRIPFGIFEVRRPGLWFMVAYYLGIAVSGAPRRNIRALYARRNLIVLLILALSAGSVMYQTVKRPEVEVVFLAVGQGDAIFIRSAGGRLFLVDGGGLPGGTRDPGRDTLLPFLKRKGIRYIDVIVCTHPHYDHIKGLFSVIDSFRVGLLVKPEIPEHMAPDIDYALVKLANERNVPVVELVKDGWIDVGDGVRIFVLNPGADSSKEAHMCHTQTDLNALSLVMRMEFMGFTLLLTGDAGEWQLDALLDSGEDLGASVLKVPHHGARDALNVSIADSIRPQVSVISVGPNPFSHPATETMEILERSGSMIFRTDLDGAVIIRTCGRLIRVRSVGSQRLCKVNL